MNPTTKNAKTQTKMKKSKTEYADVGFQACLTNILPTLMKDKQTQTYTSLCISLSYGIISISEH